MNILITTTSFQDTPGSHQQLLEQSGHTLIHARGPLPESAMLDLVGECDGILCGDDAVTRAVLEKALPRLRCLSKYGIGVDKIDIAAAKALGIPVCFTPGVNHTTVAEHVFALLLALVRQLPEEVEHTRSGRWKRLIGHEIMGKTLAIAGLGRIGKEVARRAHAFGMTLRAYDLYWDEAFAAQFGITRADSLADLFAPADVISLHTNLTTETHQMLNATTLGKMKDGVLIINCARGELVETQPMVAALESGKVGGYGADVLDAEPPPADHPLLHAPRCLVTPHVGSRTYESVVRQGTMAVQNLLLVLQGEKPLAQI